LRKNENDKITDLLMKEGIHKEKNIYEKCFTQYNPYLKNLLLYMKKNDVKFGKDSIFGFDINEKFGNLKSTFLHIVIRSNLFQSNDFETDKELVGFLLTNDASLKELDFLNSTPLHYATSRMKEYIKTKLQELRLIQQ
jgi:hypothetical protein